MCVSFGTTGITCRFASDPSKQQPFQCRCPAAAPVAERTLEYFNFNQKFFRFFSSSDFTLSHVFKVGLPLDWVTRHTGAELSDLFTTGFGRTGRENWEKKNRPNEQLALSQNLSY